MRAQRTIITKDPESFKIKLLQWAQKYDDVAWMDSNAHAHQYSNYDAILAVDALTSIQSDFCNAFKNLSEYQSHTRDWIFGYLSYDLKNDLEDLNSNNFDGLQFPDLYFFQPKKLFLIKGETVEVKYMNAVEDELEDDLADMRNCEDEGHSSKHSPVKIKLRIHKDEYFNKVNKILGHIHRGDIYEVNFCQEFYAQNTEIDPLHSYWHLNKISRPPFATFLKCRDKYLLSASPERYLRKKAGEVLSQPIKGTSKRSIDAIEDEQLRVDLYNDQKERSENIMIVDLVRNDLSKTAIKGSVEVQELSKVYSYKQVHHLISSITAKVLETLHPVDILESTFPMGSMTGAPKISAMKIIEDLEETKRGLYSGAVGYMEPNGDFDFNVVIRSILYNETNKYVSYSVGGAITAKSDPLKEYEECLIKARAMRTVLEN